MKKGKKKDWRLGSILTELTLLSAEELEFALKMTRNTGMPLGSVLLVTGALTKDELRAMIQAQSMLKDKLVDEDELLSAMPLFKEQQSLGLEGALRRIKWHRDSKVPTNKLGELLVSAKLLSQLDLAKGLAHNRNSLQPLGRTLVLIGALSPRALQHALVIQERIRKGELSREQGVTFLRDVCARNDLGAKKGKSGKHNLAPASADLTRLGDLLVEAGLVKEDEFSHAMDLSAYKSKLIGEILIECKLLSRARLDAALELQRLVGMGLVGRMQAIATLKAVDDTTSVSKVLEKNIAEETKKRLLASEALTALASHLTGLQLENPRLTGAHHDPLQNLGDNQESQSYDDVFKQAKDSPAVKRIKLVTDHLHYDVLNGALDVEQAMIVLNVCLKDECSVAQAIAKMGWTVGARPFRESEINYSDSDLIDWLTQED